MDYNFFLFNLGLMGNGYIDEDKDFDENTHCFNNAKNWQLGWYANRRVEYSHSLGSIQAFDLVTNRSD